MFISEINPKLGPIYHCSFNQNLKILRPTKIIINNGTIEKRVLGYETKQLAAVFLFYSIFNIVLSLNTIAIPYSYIEFLDRPCSMYTISNFKFVKEWYIPEGLFQSTIHINVLNEKKYPNVRYMLEYYNINIEIKCESGV